MIEKLVTSKTRMKILKLFLSHIDDRYYLRELERLLEESLSPLRRQLVKLTNMGILITEEEANLKYYRVNKNFEGLEKLKNVVLDQEVLDSTKYSLNPSTSLGVNLVEKDILSRSNNIENETISSIAPKQFRYDIAILSFVSIFVLITAVFVVYSNNKNMKQVVKLISKETVLDSAPSAPRSNNKAATASVGVGEMVSKKWKVMPGNIPALFSGEAGQEKNSKEL